MKLNSTQFYNINQNDMKKNIFVLTLLFSFIKFQVQAQVTCNPVFPSPTENITITFNANEGSRGLVNETGDIYAHSGIITDRSTSLSDWKYVKFPWTTNNATMKMTSVGNGIYTLNIPGIRSFYGVPAADKILKLAFVFRNANGSKEGKTAAGGDIYYDVYSDGSALKTLILNPTASTIFTTLNQNIEVKGAASLASTLTLTDNGVNIASATNSKELTKSITVNTDGVHLVTFKAVNGSNVDSSSFTYIVSPNVTVANPPAGMELGANYVSKDTVTLLLQAPNKQSVYVLGSFNDFTIDNKYLMKKSVDGKTWWLTLTGLTAGQTYTYQYLVEGTILVADPLSTMILDKSNDNSISSLTFPNLPNFPSKTTGQVSVIQPGKTAYSWKVNNFQRPEKKDLVIYELLLRDFISRHDYQTLIDTLPYLKNLGINAIELMPINEYENNESWGYNPSYHMALDKYYGTPDKFKELVDKCHENGIAVICDVVFNHAFGQSPLAKMYLEGGKPSATNPWLNTDAKHPYNVGFDMNHESEFTKNYVNRCLKYWLTEYKIDGYRFDLTKGFTQNPSTESTASNYDQSRIDILKSYHQTVQTASPNAYTILEHFCDNSEETVLANAGMMVWANGNRDFNEATMGWTGNSLTWTAAKSRGWSDAKHDKHIAFMESHDEERLMAKNLQFGNSLGNYSTKNPITALKRIELASAFFYAVPGPRMLWQFGELGYDISIDFNGRVGNKPINWEYLQDNNRKRLYNITRNLIHLRKSNSAFKTTNYSETDLAQGYLKAFHIQDANLSVTVLGNFDVQSSDIVPAFQSTGKWYNYISGDSITVSDKNALIRLLPGEYRVYTSTRLPQPPGGYFRYSTTATQEFAEQVNEFMIYPNPSVSGRIFIGFNLKKGGDVKWEVINTVGQVVVSSPLKTLSQGSFQDEITQKLNAGNYFIRLSVNGVTGVQKLVVGD